MCLNETSVLMFIASALHISRNLALANTAPLSDGIRPFVSPNTDINNWMS